MSLTYDYQQKLNISKEILVQNFGILAKTREFLQLVDKDRVYSITINEFNKIINRECFTEIERAYIREQRKKAVNRKAARVSRKRRREDDVKLDMTVRKLHVTKYNLLREANELRNEILFYSTALQEVNHCYQTKYQHGGYANY